MLQGPDKVSRRASTSTEQGRVLDKVGRGSPGRAGPERQLEEELAADGDGGTGSGTSPNALGIKPLTAYTQLSSAPRVTDRIRFSRTVAVMTCHCDASGEKNTLRGLEKTL